MSVYSVVMAYLVMVIATQAYVIHKSDRFLVALVIATIGPVLVVCQLVVVTVRVVQGCFWK